MSTRDNPREPSAADQDQVQALLSQAEAAAQAENWDGAIASYRKALEFDRALQGVEAKLQWALRMRDIEKLYQQGKAKLARGEYEPALADLRSARLKYASHYKDVDELIVQAQSALQKEKWGGRPMSRAAARKAERARQQRIALGVVGGIVVLALVAAFILTSGFGLLASRSTGSANTSTTNTTNSGTANSLPPAQRNNMYQNAPAMQIDPNKSYSATIETSKGNIVLDLFAKDAPQHVNNFVFLARAGYYDNLTFHRVVRDPSPFVIQGGDPLGTTPGLAGSGGPGYTIPPEIGRKHLRGSLAMARRGGDPQTTPSSGSQFYICLADLPQLDGQYTVFGQATPDSMSVADQIQIGDVIKTITIAEK